MTTISAKSTLYKIMESIRWKAPPPPFKKEYIPLQSR